MTLRRFKEQFVHINELHGSKWAIGPEDAPNFIYEKGCVLARHEEVEMVTDIIGRDFARKGKAGKVRPPQDLTNPGGVSRVKVGDHLDPDDDHNVAEALLALRPKQREMGKRLVSRNHLITITPNSCPADEPYPVDQSVPFNPARNTSAPGREIKVLVVDTGLVKDWQSHWWAKTDRVRGNLKPDKKPIVFPDLRQYEGHGTFIAGLIVTVSPSSNVFVNEALHNAGAICEYEFGALLIKAANNFGRVWPDIISLSAGTPSGCPETLLGLEKFMAELKRHQETLLVAAAGNNGSAEHFWPAAYAGQDEFKDAVLSVGALRSDGEAAACFSDYGPWVNVYAPGERLIGTFTGTDQEREYVYQHSIFTECQFDYSYVCTCLKPAHVGAQTRPGKADTVTFTGNAAWSGTSFATPLVAAMVAEYQAAHPTMSSRAAAQALLAANDKVARVRDCLEPALYPPQPQWVPVAVEKLPGA